MPDYFNIGKIVAVFGLQGEMIVTHKTGRRDALQGVDTLFVEQRKDSFLPYFVESVRAKNTGELYLKLEGIQTREAAGKLISRGVYLTEARFREQVQPDSPLYYLGFSVEDEHEGLLGAVAEVVEMPRQLLVKVYHGPHELLIPLNEDTLKGVDPDLSLLKVRLPDGLLDVYRS